MITDSLSNSMATLEEAMSGKTFEAIKDFTSMTADNTTLGSYDYTTLIVAVLAFIVSVATLIAQCKTQGNTQRITLDAQKNLLVDLIRHLYRNMVCTYAMKVKMNQLEYKAYPSEEHLIKMKIPLGNIHLDAFYGEDKNYQAMNDLFLKFRNYNEELDVVCNHFKNSSIDKATKERDFSTLLLKPGFLTEQIVNVILKVWKEEVKTVAVEKIEEAHNGATNESGGVPFTETFEPYSNENDHFITSLFSQSDGTVSAKTFLEWLNADVKNECGSNAQGAPKIYLIHL